MTSSTLFILIFVFSLLAFLSGRKRAFLRWDNHRLKALPKHYGVLTALWTGLPALLILLSWLVIQPTYLEESIISSLIAQDAQISTLQIQSDVNRILLAITHETELENPSLQSALNQYRNTEQQGQWFFSILIGLLALSGVIYGLSNHVINSNARVHVESLIRIVLFLCSGLAIITTLGIVLSVLFESLRFFESVSFFDFILGTEWSPQTSIRTDQVGSSGSFGAIPLFLGTLLISAIAMTIAVPIGLLSAIYLSEYASKNFRAYAKPALELLAGIPTVVYGFFAALTVAPLIRDAGHAIGLEVASESALAAGAVMGIMIIPFISSLSDDVITAVPQAMRDGSLALGATHSETIKKVIIPAALPGIVGGILLGVSRAIGETMIVVMAAGLAANLTANPLESVTTVTVQIVTLLTGDQEFDSPKTLAAFALGLMLFLTTLVLNVIALHTVRKYREQYE